MMWALSRFSDEQRHMMSTATDHAYDLIRKQIRDGHLMAGVRLVESRLVEICQVSRGNYAHAHHGRPGRSETRQRAQTMQNGS